MLRLLRRGKQKERVSYRVAQLLEIVSKLDKLFDGNELVTLLLEIGHVMQ